MYEIKTYDVAQKRYYVRTLGYMSMVNFISAIHDEVTNGETILISMTRVG